MTPGDACGPVDVGSVIDEHPLSRFQILIIAVCFVLSMIEGFDTQSIAFAAPVMARQWGLPPISFGPVFSLGLLGSVVGAIGVGMVQDRIGRRPSLIMAVIAFSVLTCITGFARSFDQLMLFRLLAGIGLGAAAPIYFSYASEFAPQRLRTSIVGLIVAAFPVGAVVGGMLATWLIARFGWPSLFSAGAAASLILVPILWLHFPETVKFLALRQDSTARIIAIFRRIAPERHFPDTTVFVLNETGVRQGRFRALFVRELLPGTIFLPLALFTGLLLTFCLLNWLPLLLNHRGFGVAQSVYGAVVYNLGGVIGSLGLTTLIDRVGRPLLIVAVAYLVGAAAVASIGMAGTSFPAVMTMIFAAGCLTAGPQLSLTAFIANFYPTAVRGTGIGWGQSVGRLGSLAGPLAGSYLLGLDSSAALLFPMISIAALASAATLLTFMTFFKTAADRIISPRRRA